MAIEESISIDEEEFHLQISESDSENFRRLDHYLTALLPYSRQFIKKLFEAELIQSETISLSLKKMPPIGTKISILVPPPIPSTAIAESIPLDILYEDEHLLFINKPAGLVVHPAPGHPQGTLVNALLYHCPELSGIGGVKRPGIVHRLDKGTSGVMVVAKDAVTHEGLVLLFSTHQIMRRYEAIVLGDRLPSQGVIETLIARHPTHRQKMSSLVQRGKKAITHFKVLHYFQNCTHVELELHTGRTHQIRVHMSEKMNSPILMDPLYGRPPDHLKKLSPMEQELLQNYPYPLLHAKTLGLIHPITKKELQWTVQPPPIFQQFLSTVCLKSKPV